MRATVLHHSAQAIWIFHAHLMDVVDATLDAEFQAAVAVAAAAVAMMDATEASMWVAESASPHGVFPFLVFSSFPLSL